MSEKPVVFAGFLVHLNAGQTIRPEQTSIPLSDLKELATGRIADEVGKFLTKHFLKVSGEQDGSIRLACNLTILVSEVPKGVAHTPIVFKEAPRT